MNEVVTIDRAMTVEGSTVALLTKSEIDQQIATAHRYPRSIKAFRDEAMAMVTLTETIAQECIYSLPRDNKVIEGPSARFAEICASAWGNCRVGARIVNEGPEFVTAQGVFHDLQRNVAITYEVQRRITDKRGKRFSADMIGVTANAACSIALRNAVLKGIPKAFWADMYDAARRTVMGDFKTLANRRASAIKAFKAYGVSEKEILALLGVGGVEDISPEHLVTLRGVLTAVKEGETTVEEAFGRKPPSPPSPPSPPTAGGVASTATPPKAPPPTPTTEEVREKVANHPLAPNERVTEDGEIAEERPEGSPDAQWFDALEAALAKAKDDPAEVEQVWSDLDVRAICAHEDDWGVAVAIRKRIQPDWSPEAEG